MKITICIGSSCHLKGAKQIIEQLQCLTEQNSLQNDVELCGAFCMGNCTNGVSTTIGDELFSLRPEDTNRFFDTEVLSKLKSDTVNIRKDHCD